MGHNNKKKKARDGCGLPWSAPRGTVPPPPPPPPPPRQRARTLTRLQVAAGMTSMRCLETWLLTASARTGCSSLV